MKILIAIIAGSTIGYFTGKNNPDLYSSQMVVKPNFESTRQVYTTVEYLNQLAINESYKTLSEKLEINLKDAKSLKNLYCKPILEENNKIKIYDNFISKLQDTSSASKVDYKEFIKNLSNFDNTYHEIIVESSDRQIFNKLQNNIINLIGENEFFKKNRIIKEGNINTSDSIFRKQLTEIDELRQIYNEVIKSEALNSSDENRQAGNTFNFAKDNQKTNELALLKESRIVTDKLVSLNEERIQLTSILNVVSDFNPIGKPIKSISRNKSVVFGAVFGLFMIFILILLELNKWLVAYSESLKQ